MTRNLGSDHDLSQACARVRPLRAEVSAKAPAERSSFGVKA